MCIHWNWPVAITYHQVGCMVVCRNLNFNSFLCVPISLLTGNGHPFQEERRGWKGSQPGLASTRKEVQYAAQPHPLKV